VKISDKASTVLVRHDTKDTKTPFPQISQVGDMDFFAQFFPTQIDMNKRRVQVNELRGFMGLAGMIPIMVIVQRARLAMKLAAKGVPEKTAADVQGRTLLKALGLCFPNGVGFMSNLIDMSTVDLVMTDVLPGLMVELTAEIDMAKIRETYPSMETLLNHLAEYYIVMADSGPGDIAHIDSAKTMMCLRLHHALGAMTVTVSVMLEAISSTSEGGRLLWFDRHTKNPVANPAAQSPSWPIDFDEALPGASASFRIIVDGTFRIPQLGCGSISMPLIVCKMDYKASNTLFQHPYDGGLAPSCTFTVNVLHVGEKKITSFLLRPFFNVDLLRYILIKHLRFQFQVGPGELPQVQVMEPSSVTTATQAKDDEADVDIGFFDALSEPSADVDGISMHEEILLNHAQPGAPARWSDRTLGWQARNLSPWRFIARIHLFLPPPPRVVTSCLSIFVGEQLASPDDVQLMIDLLTALAVDLRGVTARLAREKGDVAEAEIAEAEARNAAARAKESRVRLESLGVVPPIALKKTKWYWGGLFCFGGAKR